MQYTIENLTLEQVSEIYTKYLQLHFPPEEVKPLKNIQRMWGAGSYRALGMFEQKENVSELIGYAFFALTPDHKMLLLDYLAIAESYRGKGMGSIFLQEMRSRLQEFHGILIETEDVDFASNEEERYVRAKRDVFYERNGVVRTSVKSLIYTVHYANWVLPISQPASDELCKKNLEDIYKFMIPGEKNEKFVRIYDYKRDKSK